MLPHTRRTILKAGTAAALAFPTQAGRASASAKKIGCEPILKADQIEFGASAWQAETEPGAFTLRPFATVQDEAGRFDHQVES
jgi:hypothetical protein